MNRKTLRYLFAHLCRSQSSKAQPAQSESDIPVTGGACGDREMPEPSQWYRATVKQAIKEMPTTH